MRTFLSHSKLNQYKNKVLRSYGEAKVLGNMISKLMISPELSGNNRIFLGNTVGMIWKICTWSECVLCAMISLEIQISHYIGNLDFIVIHHEMVSKKNVMSYCSQETHHK